MKTRLDVLLAEKGLASSREKARALIMEGKVFVNGQREDKPGSAFDPESAEIEVRGSVLPYVSRGGLKLEKALKVFPIRLDGRFCIDIGSSTGGFTDCMLQNGAARVCAVDVGTNQLDWKLRSDPRVICMEKTNFRYVTPDIIMDKAGELPDFASCDVSFISLTKILPAAYSVLAEKNSEMVCLIKPQFEAGRDKVGKKGVVRDPEIHLEVVRRIAGFALECGFLIRGLDYSPVRGPEGNIEYLLYLVKSVSDGGDYGVIRSMEELPAAETVAAAHKDLAD